MTTTTPARRPIVGWLLALAGLLAALAIVFVFVAPALSGSWIGTIGDAAIALAFLFLFLGRVPIILRVFFAVATIGWIILTVGDLISLGTIFTVGVVLALVGTLISGVLAFGRQHFVGVGNLLFLLAMIVAAVVLLNLVIIVIGASGFLTGTLGVIVSVLYALLLLIAGLVIALRK